MRLYTVVGNITSAFHGEGNITVIINDIQNRKQPPVMLTAIGAFQKYIEKLNEKDYEEKYMKKKFTFTPWCDLDQIEVMDEDGKIIKIISRTTPEEIFTQWID